MKKAPSKSKRKSSGGQVSKKEITDLQNILLEAVLLGQPLPGSQEPVRFPDLPFVLKKPTIKLLAENLAGSISVKNSPRPVDVVSRSEMMEQARSGGEVAYLYFHSPRVDKNEVELTLAGRLVPQDLSQSELGLSSVSMKFRKINGEWQVADNPTYSAA